MYLSTLQKLREHVYQVLTECVHREREKLACSLMDLSDDQITENDPLDGKTLLNVTDSLILDHQNTSGNCGNTFIIYMYLFILEKKIKIKKV